MLLMNLGISWGLLGDFGDYLAIFRRFQIKWISIWFLQSLEEGFIFSNLSECGNYLRWLFVECLNGGDPSQRRLGVTPLFFCHLAGFSPGNFPILERGLHPLSNRHEVSSRTPFVRDLPYWEGLKDRFPTDRILVVLSVAKDLRLIFPQKDFLLCHFERSEKSPQFEFICSELPAKIFVCSKFDFIASKLIRRQWNAHKIGVKI